MRVAFLTTRLAPHFVTDDDLALDPLRRRGAMVEYVRWRDAVDWGGYDLVVVRSPWDYQHDLDGFLGVLRDIEDSGTPLENPLPLIRWNVRKGYLRELAAAGVATIPTLWPEGLAPGDLAAHFDALGVDEIVVKPYIGASGEDTFRVSRPDVDRVEPALLNAFAARALMVQPFLSRVLAEGELSVVLMDGRVSHGLRKVPVGGEFRSQEEWGGRILPADAPTELVARSQSLLATAAELAGVAGAVPLYGRADFIPSDAGWLLGELELVEPALYLRTEAGAPERFAAAVVDRANRSAAPAPPR